LTSINGLKIFSVSQAAPKTREKKLAGFLDRKSPGANKDHLKSELKKHILLENMLFALPFPVGKWSLRVNPDNGHG
jgi:hypothetical protein